MEKDRRDVLVSYLKEGLKICNGLCNTCAAKDPAIMYDEQLLNDTSVRNSMEERRRHLGTNKISPEYICPLGLTLGRMIKDYAAADASNYRNLLLSAAGDLIFDSVKLPNSREITKTLVFAIKYLDDSKKEVPFVPEKTETTEMIIVPSPIQVPTNRMSPSAKRLLDY
jgi:hypothetical protein